MYIMEDWELTVTGTPTKIVGRLFLVFVGINRFNLCVILFPPHQLVSEPKFLIKMSSKRSEGEESEYPFFKGDGSSSDEWRDYGMASDDYEGPPVFDDDQYEDVIEEEEGFVDNAIEEEGFVGKGGFGVLDGVVPTTPSKGVEGSTSIITQEHDALLAAATEISKQAQKGIEIIDDPQNCVTTKGQGKGNSRGRNMRSSRNSSIKKDDENKKEAALVNESGLSSANKDKEVENILANENSTSGVSFLKKHVDTSESDKRIPPVHFYAYESGQKVLDILKPSEIIVYHPDIAFVREIKVYKAENPSKKLVSEPKFLIKMSSKRSEGEELEYLFFESDGSSSDEWRDYGMAGDDYEGPSIFDDDQYEEESMPVYDTDIEDVIEVEEGFIEKEGFGGKEDNIEDVVVVANDLCSSMIQTTLNVDFEEDINTKSHNNYGVICEDVLKGVHFRAQTKKSKDECSNYLYAISIKKDMAYLCPHTRNREELKSNTSYPEDFIRRIEDYLKILEDIERGPYSKKPPIRHIDLNQYGVTTNFHKL
ncbi:hypothetical protein Tco_0442451 [Tanacetum coccineum]